MKRALLVSCMLLVTTGVFASETFTPISVSEAKPAPAVQTAAPVTSSPEDIFGNEKIQGAILQIDNAQVEIRNQLLDLKTKFADVDAQFVSVKAERKALKSQLKQAEKRLKALESAKEKMRKNMI